MKRPLKLMIFMVLFEKVLEGGEGDAPIPGTGDAGCSGQPSLLNPADDGRAVNFEDFRDILGIQIRLHKSTIGDL